MENNKVQEALTNLRDVLRSELSKNTTSVKIILNCEGIRMSITDKTSEELKKSNISMRNINGDFI